MAIDQDWIDQKRAELQREAEQARANWTALQGALQLLDQIERAVAES